jgi:site-specific DNA-methyltransferase (adenine-specific)
MTEEQVKKTGKKFDVVVMNPPYQDDASTNTKNLWPKFVDTALSLTRADGVVAAITPRTWTTNEMYERVFLANQTLYINIDECARHFPTVNSTFSWFVIKKGVMSTGAVDIITADGVTQHIQLPVSGLGAKSSGALTILDKASTGSYFDPFTSYRYHTDRFTKNHDTGIARTESNTHPYEILHKQAADGTRTVFFADQPDDKQHQVPRVITSLWVGRWKDMLVSADIATCQQFIQFRTQTVEQAHVLRTVLQSKLYTFIMLNTVSGGSLTMRSVRYFPVVDLSHPWTDNELYQHFKLTQDEIDLIERTVK